MRRAPAIMLALLAASTCMVGSALGARVLRTDFEGLVDKSAMIVEGEVLSVDISAGQIEPRTRVTLRIDRHFDGHHPGSHLTFDLPMGQMSDGTVLDIAEAPRFAPGARYLIFYKRGDWNITPVVGWSQGYFRAERVDGVELLVDAGGHCVTGLGRLGFELGPRVADPASMPGFGEPVVIGEAPHGHGPHGEAACQPADALRALLQSRLAHAPVPPTVAWRATPARSILRRALKPAPIDATACGAHASCPGTVRP